MLCFVKSGYTVTRRKHKCGTSHPAVDPLVSMKPNLSVSGSRLTSDPASEPELSSSLRFFWAGLDGLNILLKDKSSACECVVYPRNINSITLTPS